MERIYGQNAQENDWKGRESSSLSGMYGGSKKNMLLYRGSLKSCNYSCSYCPFSKHRMTDRELARDKEQWAAFLHRYLKQVERPGRHALMLAPYGEALIHPWYWEGLAKVSASARVEAAGAQTNLGFAAASLDIFRINGGIPKKLRLWATFHPEMTTPEVFAEKCRQLTQAGITICAGAVGVPKYLRLLQQLRKELPKEIYLWMNRMDGLGRSYTEQEIQAFSQIDPYFYRELALHPADVSQCQERLFVEGNGRQRLCNISSVQKTGAKSCGRRRCFCYLAYGGRKNLVNEMLFGPWPLFRIPRRPRAVFLDIEGTLLADGGESALGRREVSADVQEALKVLAGREQTLLFFATTLPYEEAVKRCRTVWPLFSGGIFAAGAHILFRQPQQIQDMEGKRDGEKLCAAEKSYVYFLDEEIVQYLGRGRKLLQDKKGSFRMLVYQSSGRCYKITLLHARQKPWDRQDAEAVMNCLPGSLRGQVRYLLEGSCMQIVAARAGKAAGVRMICGWLQIPLEEIFAAGDSAEDAQMMEIMDAKQH